MYSNFDATCSFFFRLFRLQADQVTLTTNNASFADPSAVVSSDKNRALGTTKRVGRGRTGAAHFPLFLHRLGFLRVRYARSLLFVIHGTSRCSSVAAGRMSEALCFWRPSRGPLHLSTQSLSRAGSAGRQERHHCRKRAASGRGSEGATRRGDLTSRRTISAACGGRRPAGERLSQVSRGGRVPAM